jgi:hypothetical protein
MKMASGMCSASDDAIVFPSLCGSRNKQLAPPRCHMTNHPLIIAAICIAGTALASVNGTIQDVAREVGCVVGWCVRDK